MSNRKRTALVICPGRGTYNKGDLGYLRRLHAAQSDFLQIADAYRKTQNQLSIRELDSRPDYDLSLHTRNDNAGPLIFSCSWCDFLSIARSQYEVVAVTGNSMGWYTALACAGVLSAEQALWIVNSMGSYLHAAHTGGQVICTTVGEDWDPLPNRRDLLLDTLRLIHETDGMELYVSIELGGMIVVSGNEPGLEAFIARIPRGPGRFPLRLYNHGAFHSPLQRPVSERAKAALPQEWYGSPAVPIIDGRGRIWWPHATESHELWEYTLGTQVTDTYYFTRAIQVAVREFAPDCLILLGPGDTLGGAVAQSLIEIRWRGLNSKKAFVESARSSPYLLSMGREDQRSLVVGSTTPS